MFYPCNSFQFPSGARWVLKNIAETLGAIENVPFRILDCKVASQIAKEVKNDNENPFMRELDIVLTSKKSELSSKILNAKSCHQSINKIFDRYNTFKVEGYTAPFFSMLSNSSAWRCSELVWCLSRCILRSERLDESVELISYGSLYETEIAIAEYYIADLQIIIQVGPSWHLSDEGMDEFLDIERRDAFVRKILSETVIVHEINESISIERLIRLSNQRSAISSLDLTERLSRIREVILTISRSRALQVQSTNQLQEILININHDIAVNTENMDVNTIIPLREVEGGAKRWLSAAKVAAIGLHEEGGRREYSVIDQVKLDALGETILRNNSHQRDIYITNRSAYLLERLQLYRLMLQSTLVGWTTEDTKNNHLEKVLSSLARSVCELFWADSCCIYKYNSLKNSLKRIGGHFTDQQANALGGVADQLMESASVDEALRAKSVSYRCIDRGSMQYISDAKPEELLLSSYERYPKSIIVVHLLFQRRVWGVIELKGDSAYQFSRSTARWLEELSRVITPILYDRSLIECMSSMSKAVISEVDVEQKYSEIIRQFTTLMMSNSGSLFIRDLRRTKLYTCRACIGRPVLSERMADFHFDIEDEGSVTAKILKENAIWKVGEIGHHPFDGAWLSKPEVAAMISAGHRFIAVIPIRKANKECVGSITITSKVPFKYLSTWKNHVSYFVEYIGMLLEAVNLQETKEDFQREYRAHSIKTRSDRLSAAMKKINAIMEPLFSDDGIGNDVIPFLDGVSILASQARKPIDSISQDANIVMSQLRKLFSIDPIYSDLLSDKGAYQVKLSLADINDCAKELRMSAEFLLGERNIFDPFEADPKTWDGTWADFRACLTGALKPLVKAGKLLWAAPSPAVLPWGVKIRIPPSILTEIINNMSDNAIKYSLEKSGHPLINVFVNGEIPIVKLIVANIGPELGEDERQKLGVVPFRGRYAQTVTQDGAGMGLKFCFQHASKWGGDLRYNPRSIKGSDGRVWHRFELVFSGDLVSFPMAHWR